MVPGNLNMEYNRWLSVEWDGVEREMRVSDTADHLSRMLIIK